MVHTRQLRQRWCWTSGSVRGPRLMPVTDLHWYHFCEPITEFSAIPWCHHRFGVKGQWSLHGILWEQVGLWCEDVTYLIVFFQIVVQRMADQLPMMITFYMLQETAQVLTIDTMKLLEKPDVHELLSEDSDVSRRRKDLRARLNRLTSAAKAISNFFND